MAVAVAFLRSLVLNCVWYLGEYLGVEERCSTDMQK